MANITKEEKAERFNEAVLLCDFLNCSFADEQASEEAFEAAIYACKWRFSGLFLESDKTKYLKEVGEEKSERLLELDRLLLFLNSVEQNKELDRDAQLAACRACEWRMASFSRNKKKKKEFAPHTPEFAVVMEYVKGNKTHNDARLELGVLAGMSYRHAETYLAEMKPRLKDVLEIMELLRLRRLGSK